MQYRSLLLLAVWLLGHHATLTRGCFEMERAALLAFKAGIIDTGNRLSSWAGRDCCSWRGVVCDYNTGHVVKLNLQDNYNCDANSSDCALRGEINPSLLVLSHLKRLDLSGNDFGGISVPKFIGSLKGLMHLDLSRSNFGGEFPAQLGNLSNLRYLDLSDSNFICTTPPQLNNLSRLHTLRLSDAFAFDSTCVDNLSWLPQLSSIRVLDLSMLNLSNVTGWLEVVNTLHFLTELSLSACRLSNIPTSLPYLNFTSLKFLDISDNGPFNTTLPTWLWNLTKLSYLDLGSSGYHGKIPDSLGNLISLNTLYLESNNFKGSIPTSIQNMCNLVSIDLSSIGIGGDIAELVGPLHCSWKNMETLVLGRNKLHGSLFGWLEEMKNLSSLDLSNNLLSGPIPPGIGRLSNLRRLDLSYNSLQGVIYEAHFANLPKLEELTLSSNSLIIDVDQYWIPPFQLSYLSLDSCQFSHHQFPAWLRWQMQIYDLNLSDTGIRDTVPAWFWNLPYQYLDLSHNQIRGKLPMSLQFTILEELILRSNKLEGPIPSLPNTLVTLDLSENSISGSILPPISNMLQLSYLSLSSNQINGSIPYDLCKQKFLQVLDLSNNSLSGELPQCWNNSFLLILDLSNNNLAGEIPSSIDSLSSLTSLHLNNNNFYGELPLELQHCNSLVLLDLSNNKFTGEIPTWIGENLEDLVILQLRSNMFVGEIPSELAQLTYLQFLDLAHNNLTGSIPHSFGNFSSMIYNTIPKHDGNILYTVDERLFTATDYSNNLLVVIKGNVYQYSTTIYLLKVMDLSKNNLSGQIPEEIVTLGLLQSLNLSGNRLTGMIPESLGDMRSLESLDLSLNELQGAIPQSLSALTFLNHLNLSYNNLTGRIPTGNQLSTLDNPSIYIGNTYLCGPPTGKNCSENETLPNVVGDDYDGSESTWLYLGMGLGFVAGFWGVCGILIFKESWSSAYFQMVDRLYDKIYVIIAIRMRRLNRNMQG